MPRPTAPTAGRRAPVGKAVAHWGPGRHLPRPVERRSKDRGPGQGRSGKGTLWRRQAADQQATHAPPGQSTGSTRRLVPTYPGLFDSSSPWLLLATCTLTASGPTSLGADWMGSRLRGGLRCEKRRVEWKGPSDHYHYPSCLVGIVTWVAAEGFGFRDSGTGDLLARRQGGQPRRTRKGRARSLEGGQTMFKRARTSRGLGPVAFGGPIGRGLTGEAEREGAPAWRRQREPSRCDAADRRRALRQARLGKWLARAGGPQPRPSSVT